MKKDITNNTSMKEEEIIKIDGIELKQEIEGFQIINEQPVELKGDTLLYILYGDEWYDDECYYGPEPIVEMHEGEEISINAIKDAYLYMIYNSQFTPEVNRKLLKAYEADYEFIAKHINDLDKCLGGIDGIKQVVKDWHDESDSIMELEEYLEMIEKEYNKMQNDKNTQQISDLASKKLKLAKTAAEAKTLVEKYKEPDKDSQVGQSMSDDE